MRIPHRKGQALWNVELKSLLSKILSDFDCLAQAANGDASSSADIAEAKLGVEVETLAV